MKLYLSSVFVLLGLAMQSQQITQQFNFSQNDIEINVLDNYDLVRLADQGFLNGEDNAGKPQLPVAHFSILLPQGATATNVSITVQQEQQITGTFNIYPAQLPAYPNFEAPPEFIVQDPVIYASNTQFPQDYLLDYTTNAFRDYNYVSVSFIPFKYLPQSQQLFLLSQVNISISYTVNSNSQAFKLRPYNNIDEAAYNNIKKSVYNSNDIDNFYPEVISKINGYKSLSTVQGYAYDTSAMPSLEGNEVQYVIITNNTDISGTPVGDFTTKFQDYANWKTQSGTPAKVVSVDEIRANYPGVDIPEQLRNFIKDAAKLWGTEYVLLGGGASIIPVRWVNGTNMPTDLYYSAICHPFTQYDDDWNADGDNKFAENISSGGFPDFADYTPDIAVGRAPVDTNTEVETFLKKNFTYARCSFATNIPDGIWLDRELMGYGAAFNYDWGESLALKVGYDIIQAHHSHTNIYGMFEYYPDWELPDNHPDWCYAYYDIDLNSCTDNGVVIMDAPDLTHEAFLSKINEGYNLINVLEHGGPYALGLGSATKDTPPLEAHDFQNLTDTGKYGVFLAGGCHSAPIERDYYMGEQWVNAPGAGVSYYGASKDIDVLTSYSFNKKFYNTLYDSNIFKQGSIHSFSAFNTDTPDYLYKIIQLLGDPDLSIYTDSPINLIVSHAEGITNGNQDFSVNVPSFPIGEKVKVSVYKDGEVLAYNETDIFPVTFNITPDTVGELTITATCHNAEPYEANIGVTQLQNGVHLYNSDITLLDENQNGIIEPGETIDLIFELSNTGDTNETNISGILSTTDLNTQIVQGTSSYPDIASGQSASSITNYTFKASEQGYESGVIPFVLTITSANGPFTEPFLLEVSSSVLDIGDRSVLVNNEETNIFNVDDEVEIFVDIHNYSTITAENITAVLTTSLASNIATISNHTEVYGDIDSQSQATNPNAFVVTIEQDYNGEALPFVLTLTDTFGKTDVFEIDLTEDFPDTISNFNFTSTGNYINTTWLALQGVKGYNIYRSDAEQGVYVKVNTNSILNYAMFTDDELTAYTEYWYKISAVSLSGNELNIEELNPKYAYTTLANHGDFPIQVQPLTNIKANSSPTVYDVDGDGTKEIFINLMGDYSSQENKGRILGFYETGVELFDIDNNPDEIWGFAETELSLPSNSAIGDIDNNGLAEVFLVGRNMINQNVSGVLYGFQSVDTNNDGKPDKLWVDGEVSIGQRTFRNPVLADVDNDDLLEIIILDEDQRIIIYKNDGSILGEKRVGIVDDIYSMGELAIADIDNDGFKEIIFGCNEVNNNDIGAIYIWNHDGDFENTNLELIKEFGPNERADGGPILADIDNDGNYEILTITKNGTLGRIYALNIEDGTYVNTNWEGTFTIPTVNGQNQQHIIPRMAVGDLNRDGNLEVVFSSKNVLYVLDNLGNVLPNFPISINGTWENAPILADIDEDSEIEIIINSGGTLYAYNYDGTECIGWRLQSATNTPFVGSPFVGDIDDDGLNEVVISSEDYTTYVWDTVGDANKVEWGSYRANAQNTAVYKEQCLYADINSIEVSSPNTLWNTDRHIQGDLVIKSNADLTITSKVTFTKESKVIVETGAKLTIDGGELTSDCGRLWKGIRVIGNKGLAQNPADQGTLILKNNAEISHAETAIYTGYSAANRDLDTGSGGIVNINDSFFKDNIEGIVMPSYYFENSSHIKTTTFETTSYLKDINELPESHILFWEVGSIVIKENTFLNVAEIDPYTNINNLLEQGNGIEIYNSKVYILNNSFENLNSAIKVQGFGASWLTTVIDIEDNTFDDNWNGVYLNSIDGVKIISNQINVFGTHLDGQGENGSSGLYIVNSNGFHIEDNLIYSLTPLRLTTGIFIRDCEAINDIYKNNFTDLYTGIYAMGINTKPSFIPGIYEGLTFTCNDFVTNNTDIYVANNSTIAKYQGSLINSAGNTFSPECFGSYKEFDNTGIIQINYTGENSSEYLPDCNYNVNVFNTSAHNECPAILGLTGTPSEIATLDNEIINTKSVLLAITDGGDTEALNETIEDTQNNESLLLRNKLLSESPFLSDTIMVKSTVVEDVLPSIMVKEVLAANPKAAKSEKVQTALDNRQNQLPYYMRDEIDLGKNIMSQKELLENKLAMDVHFRESLINRRMNSFMRDSLGQSVDSLRTQLINESQYRLNRSYQLVDYYLSNGETQNAQSALTSMDSIFDFTSVEQYQYGLYSQLFDLKMDLKISNKNWFTLTSEQESELNSLAIDSTSSAGMQSRVILSLIANIDYGLPIPAKVVANRNFSSTEILEERFEVSPKTATDYFIIDYVLAQHEKVTDVEIAVFDDKNREVKNLPVTRYANQFLIECEMWKEGIYWCEKLVNGEVSAKVKVVVDRGGLINSNEIQEETYFKIYPNPAGDYFFVKTNISTNTVLQITNALGINMGKYLMENGFTKILTASWGSGIYFVSLLENDKLIDTIKIIVD